MKLQKTIILFSFCIILGMISCQKKHTGDLTVNFKSMVYNSPIKLREMIYVNAAENPYQVNEIKYFISKFFLIKSDGNWVKITDNSGIHYADLSDAKTLKWTLKDVEEGEYKGIAFIFGLDEQDNKSHRFPNPPESNFSWPDILGGGYHYLQINGKYKDRSGEEKSMNFHSGIGQLYKNNVLHADSIYAYIHNYFSVKLPVNFKIEKGKTSHLDLIMNVDAWFDAPIVYDHNYFGSGIMQNQQAQAVIKENGKNVFEAR